MLNSDLSFVHHFVPGEGTPILLLHGTGGDENTLLAFGRSVAAANPLLSPRGKVLENGRCRFFRRFAEGVLDEEDVRRQAAALADFIDTACASYRLPPPLAIGFSNGANIAAAVLLLRPQTLAGAALLRPMMPLREPPDLNLAGKPVLIIAAENDAVIPPGDGERLIECFRQGGATVVDRTVASVGHELSSTDSDIVADWLRDLPVHPSV
ncbi:alpha/beta hydrolase [Mesorhizobium sp. 1M-11]|uniref:alpha/beta hydrolase n=1 Tax=Mesorhizobium sp. 1M-11 TaxID=1529006 RepID=UPI0006C75334|nr:alpha/beta hydrolase [Mesorhizobium sp. 1M-11]